MQKVSGPACHPLVPGNIQFLQMLLRKQLAGTRLSPTLIKELLMLPVFFAGAITVIMEQGFPATCLYIFSPAFILLPGQLDQIKFCLPEDFGTGTMAAKYLMLCWACLTIRPQKHIPLSTFPLE